MNNIYKYDKIIESILRKIPEIIAKYGDISIETKSNERDLVTTVDKGVEEYISSELLKHFPGSEILGEETYEEGRSYDKSKLFVIDPIDGTTNFVKQRDDFCTILSYFEDGKPQLAYVYEVNRDLLYSIIRGEGIFINGKKIEKPEDKTLKEALITMDLRRMIDKKDIFEKSVRDSFGTRGVGSAGLDSIKVAIGKTGAYMNPKAGPWDFSPCFLMAEELGLHFSDLEGKEMTLDGYSSFIISTKSVYRDIFEDE